MDSSFLSIGATDAIANSPVESLSSDDSVQSGNGKKSKILIGLALLAVIGGAAAFFFTPRKSSLGDAVKTAGLNVTSSGKLKLFDPLSKCLLSHLIFSWPRRWFSYFFICLFLPYLLFVR